MRPVNMALLSLTVGILFLHFNWLPAFGWFFVINTLIIVFVALFVQTQLAKYRGLVVLLAFVICLIPLSILAFSLPVIIDSIESTKIHLNEMNPLNARVSVQEFSPAPNATKNETERVEMVFVDG